MSGCHETAIDADGHYGPCDKPIVGLSVDRTDTPETYPACAEHAVMVEVPAWYCHDHGGIAEGPDAHCDRRDDDGCHTVPLYREPNR